MSVRRYGEDVGAGCWQLASVAGAFAAPGRELDELLADGWEPFAAFDVDVVWLRRTGRTVLPEDAALRAVSA